MITYKKYSELCFEFTGLWGTIDETNENNYKYKKV